MRKNLNVFIGALGVLFVFITLAFSISEENKHIKKTGKAKSVNAGSVYDYMFNIRRNQVTGNIPSADVAKARKATKASMKKSLGLTWESRGPNNFGGRTRCILYDQSDPSTIFIGSVSGGLFVSHTGGSSWLSVADMENMAVTSITQAANNDIYVGTGEGFANRVRGDASGGDFIGPSGILGQGVFKSTDGGVTFTQLSSTWKTAEDPLAWLYVSEMASSSTDANKIYAATFSGLMVSEDAGATWANTISAQVITLKGAGGTGTINIDASSYTIDFVNTIDFDTDLDTTAYAFVIAEADAILTNDNVAVVNMDSTLIFYDLDNSNPVITISNASGAVSQVTKIALVGTVGNADIYIDGAPYNLSFNGDLATTASDFAGTSISGVTATSDGDSIFLTSIVAGNTFSIDSIVNDTGNVAQVDEYTLTGTSGSAILTINTTEPLDSASYQIVFDSSLVNTAKRYCEDCEDSLMVQKILDKFGIIVTYDSTTIILTANDDRAGYGFTSSLVNETPIAQVVQHVISGSCGTANISVDDVDYLLTFNTDDTITASDFVTTWDGSIPGVTVTSSHDTITITADSAGIPFSTNSATNATGLTKQKERLTFSGSQGAILLTLKTNWDDSTLLFKDSVEYLVGIENGDINQSAQAFFTRNVAAMFKKGIALSASGPDIILESIYPGVCFETKMEQVMGRKKVVNYVLTGDSGVAYIPLPKKSYELIFQGDMNSTAQKFFDEHAHDIDSIEGIIVSVKDSMLVFTAKVAGVYFAVKPVVTYFGNLSANISIAIPSFPVPKQIAYHFTGTKWKTNVYLPVGTGILDVYWSDVKYAKEGEVALVISKHVSGFSNAIKSQGIYTYVRDTTLYFTATTGGGDFYSGPATGNSEKLAAEYEIISEAILPGDFNLTKTPITACSNCGLEGYLNFAVPNFTTTDLSGTYNSVIANVTGLTGTASEVVANVTGLTGDVGSIISMNSIGFDVEVGSDGSVAAVVGKSVFTSPTGAVGTYSIRSSHNDATLLPISEVGRIEIDIAPSDPNYIYASVGSDYDGLKGVYRSIDAGASWSLIGPGELVPSQLSPLEDGYFANTVAVHPTNKGKVLVAGLDIWEWTISDNWSKISSSELYVTDTLYVNKNIHDIAYHPSNPDKYYIATDAGINGTNNGGESYFNTNANYVSTQIVGAEISTDGQLLMGTVSNGSLYNSGMDINPGRATQLYSEGTLDFPEGEIITGGAVVISKLDPQIIFYAGSDYNRVFRSEDRGTTVIDISQDWSYSMVKMDLWESNNDTNNSDSTYYKFTERSGDTTGAVVRVPSKTIFAGTGGQPHYFYETLTADYSTSQDSIWFTDRFNSRLVVSGRPGSVLLANDPLNIGAIPAAFGFGGKEDYLYVRIVLDSVLYYSGYSRLLSYYNIGNATAIRFSADGDKVWVGMSGKLFRVSNMLNVRGPKTRENLVVEEILDFSGRTITDISTSRHSSSHVVVTLGNYGNTDYVFESTNADASAASVTFSTIQGNLPAMPAYSTIINLNDASGDEILVGTENGIYATSDGGSTWALDNSGMPTHVPVTDLFQQYWPSAPNFGNLVAGTYGRGVYVESTYVGIEEDEFADNASSHLSLYPNPVNGIANLRITVSAKVKSSSLNVYDLNGRIVHSEEVSLFKGTNNIKLGTGKLSAGTYIVSVGTNDGIAATKMVVIK